MAADIFDVLQILFLLFLALFHLFHILIIFSVPIYIFLRLLLLNIDPNPVITSFLS